MATQDVRKPNTKNAGKQKKGTSTGDSSETKLPEKLRLLLEQLEQAISLVEPAKEEIIHLQERITCYQETSSQKLESQLFEVRNENTKLLQDMEEMIKDRDKLKQANLKIQALENEQKEKDIRHTEETNAFKEGIQRKEELLQKTVRNLEETKNLSAQQEKELQKKIDIQNQEKSRLTTALRNFKEERDKLEKELSNTKTRLSKLMSDKLSHNNPDIADLSDENRPTKIGEKFQELYDNQWTDAYEIAEKHFQNMDENARINVLGTMLMNIHSFCEREFSEQENALVQALYRTNKVVRDQPLAIKTLLKDLKRRVSTAGIENITQKFLESADKTTQEGDFILQVKDFVRECVTICWLMVLQDPPLAFDTDVTSGRVFDSNRYKAFTVTGSKIDFLVWPSLLLQKNGSVLTKGIVQCKKDFDGSKSVRGRSRRVNDSEMGIPTGSVCLTKDVKIDTAKWLQDLGDSKKSTNDSSEEKVCVARLEKKSNNSRTATTESQCGSTNHSQDVQTTVDYQKNRQSSASGDQSDNANRYQSHAGNVPQNQEYPQPHTSSQQVKGEAHGQFVTNQYSDPILKLQNTNVVPSECYVAQQNQDTQNYGQLTTTQSVTNEHLGSAQYSQLSLFQQPTYSSGNDFMNQQHFYPNSVSLSTYPQYLIPTTEEWRNYLWCVKYMNEADAKHNLGWIYDKCKRYHDWLIFKRQHESQV